MSHMWLKKIAAKFINICSKNRIQGLNIDGIFADFGRVLEIMLWNSIFGRSVIPEM